MSTVLVVEDNLTQQQVLSWVLKKMGLTVIVANDGVEALEKVNIYSPDLVVLDIILPRMNGYEVCRRLRSDVKTQNLPVVMCSAKKEEFDRYWGIKQGANASLTKPYETEKIVETVKSLLQKTRQPVR
ncbi:MAG TPA: two-component system response regulator [Cyanobacteria bacterium UBA11148]|nr:two-component system response regulator [Cyanobacteria bacterium UBA11148]